MRKNSRVAIQCVVILLFAIIGHEALMVGAHAGSVVVQGATHASHEVHDAAAQSRHVSISSISKSDDDHCVPGHEFARRIDESGNVRDHADLTSKPALISEERSHSGSARGVTPGRPANQIRALLQVFLN